MTKLFVTECSVVQLSSPAPLYIQDSNARVLFKNTLIFLRAIMVKDLAFLRKKKN